MKVHLLLIDCQNDFCDPKGNLFVTGADNDMKRLTAWVKKNKSKVDAIHATLDCHRLVDIAHPIFWKDSSGKHPSPFTIISFDDVEHGKWLTTMPGHYKRAREYVKTLQTNGRYPLCIWPPHCLIGSWGNNVVPDLFNAFQEWEQSFKLVDFVTKGSNPWTEHYSAVSADVPDPQDPGTQINTRLITALTEADIIGIAGEASSHCIRSTITDIANNFGDESYIKKFVYLKDCASPVPGFEKFETDFLDEMKKRGMQISDTTNFLQ